MTVFLQVFVLTAAIYAGLFAHTQLRRHLRRWRRRRSWRQLEATHRRPPSPTPPHPA